MAVRVLHLNQLPVVRMPVLEILEVMQRLLAVEQLDVPRLRRGQATNRPAKMHEVRLDRRDASDASRSRSAGCSPCACCTGCMRSRRSSTRSSHRVTTEPDGRASTTRAA